jgi:endoglucanase
VRAGAPNNLVLIGTPNWCQIVSPAANNPIDGENVAYVAHMYPMHWEQQSLRDEITTAAESVPVFVSEWGYEEGSDEVVDGNQSNYGEPFKQFIEQQQLSWTAWVAHNTWFPSMFDNDWNLLVGEGYMGGFAKDWLYERRNDDLAAP